MTAEIRWLALLPDPVTGLDAPVMQISGKPMIWVAVDKRAAQRQVKAAIDPKAYRLAAVVSLVDWDARQQTPQRSKLVQEPGAMFGGVNPTQRCFRCGAPTPTRAYRFCPKHTNYGGRPRKAATAPSDPLDPNAGD